MLRAVEGVSGLSGWGAVDHTETPRIRFQLFVNQKFVAEAIKGTYLNYLIIRL